MPPPPPPTHTLYAEPITSMRYARAPCQPASGSGNEADHRGQEFRKRSKEAKLQGGASKRRTDIWQFFVNWPDEHGSQIPLPVWLLCSHNLTHALSLCQLDWAPSEIPRSTPVIGEASNLSVESDMSVVRCLVKISSSSWTGAGYSL